MWPIQDQKRSCGFMSRQIKKKKSKNKPPKLSKENNKVYVAVVWLPGVFQSKRLDGDFTCFVDQTRNRAIERALRARNLWVSSVRRRHNDANWVESKIPSYCIAVGELSCIVEEHFGLAYFLFNFQVVRL